MTLMTRRGAEPTPRRAGRPSRSPPAVPTGDHRARLRPLRRLALAGSVMLLVGASATTVAAAALPTSAAPAAPTPPPAAALAAISGKTYVALGDSYTADWGVDPVSADEPSTGCRQSANDYPHQVAAGLGLVLHDVSCAGAVTANMTAPQTAFPTQGSFPPAPPQFDALSADTDIVTIGIGGNDFGFADIAAACALDPVTGYVLGGADWPSDTFLTNCKAYYDPDGTPANDQLRARVLQVVAPRVRQTVAAVTRRAPNAKVFFVDYLAISPDAASAPDPSTYPGSCYLSLFNSQAFPFGAVDTPYLAMEQRLFNQAIDTAAAAAGATVVSTYAGSLTHTACAGTPDPWVNGITVSVFQQAGRSAGASTSGASTSGGSTSGASTSGGSASATTSGSGAAPPGPEPSTTAASTVGATRGSIAVSPASTVPTVRPPRPQLGASVAVGSLHPNLEGAVHQSESVTRALLAAFPGAPPGSTTAAPAPLPTRTTATTPTVTTTSRPAVTTPRSSTATSTTRASTAAPTTVRTSATTDGLPTEADEPPPVAAAPPPDLAATGPAPIARLLLTGLLAIAAGAVVLAVGRTTGARRRTGRPPR